MRQRHRARRLALQALCSLDVQGEKARPQAEQFIQDSDDLAEARLYATELLDRTWQRRDECDKVLVQHARKWELPRLAMVDRNILRMGVSELVEGKTPHKVIIAEAIKLAQEFSTTESSRFVNGVLDAVARATDEG